MAAAGIPCASCGGSSASIFVRQSQVGTILTQAASGRFSLCFTLRRPPGELAGPNKPQEALQMKPASVTQFVQL